MHCSAKYCKSVHLAFTQGGLGLFLHVSKHSEYIPQYLLKNLGAEQIASSCCLICTSIAVFPSCEWCFYKHEVGLRKLKDLHVHTSKYTSEQKEKDLALCSTGFQECWYKYPLVLTFLLIHFIPKILASANHQACSFIFLTVCMDKLGFLWEKIAKIA